MCRTLSAYCALPMTKGCQHLNIYFPACFLLPDKRHAVLDICNLSALGPLMIGNHLVPSHRLSARPVFPVPIVLPILSKLINSWPW